MLCFYTLSQPRNLTTTTAQPSMTIYNQILQLNVINKFIKTTRENGSRVLVVTGRRRLGKTRFSQKTPLVLAFDEIQNPLHLYSIFDGTPKYIEELIDMGGKDFQERLKSLFIA